MSALSKKELYKALIAFLKKMDAEDDKEIKKFIADTKTHTDTPISEVLENVAKELGIPKHEYEGLKTEDMAKFLVRTLQGKTYTMKNIGYVATSKGKRYMTGDTERLSAAYTPAIGALHEEVAAKELLEYEKEMETLAKELERTMEITKKEIERSVASKDEMETDDREIRKRRTRADEGAQPVILNFRALIRELNNDFSRHPGVGQITGADWPIIKALYHSVYGESEKIAEHEATLRGIRAKYNMLRQHLETHPENAGSMEEILRHVREMDISYTRYFAMIEALKKEQTLFATKYQFPKDLKQCLERIIILSNMVRAFRENTLAYRYNLANFVQNPVTSEQLPALQQKIKEFEREVNLCITEIILPARSQAK